MFRFDGTDYPLASMLDANCDDCELCAWLRGANVGDSFPSVSGPVVRIA